MTRVAIEAGARTVALDLHPRVTVITGAGKMERDSLVNDLVGSLNSTRPGTHLEFTDDEDGHMAVFRPHGAPPCVVDVTRGIDVTARYAPAGTIDLLAPLGLDAHAARRLMAIDATELRSDAQSRAIVDRLAAVEPADLWNQAADVQYTLTDLRQTAEDAGTTPEDAEVVERIEDQHATQLEAAAAFERVRRLSFFMAVVATLGAIPLAVLEGQRIASPFLLFAAVSALISGIHWLRWDRVRNAESTALEEVGANSYLGFHIQRVETLLGNDQQRRRLMAASDAYHMALEDWEALVGDVSVEWALEHQDDIAAARARLEQQGAVPTPESDGLDTLASALLARMERLAAPGWGGASFPLLLDEPFEGTDGQQVADLLELLLRESAHHQVVILTQDERVVSWARVASRDGLVGVTEPSAGTTAPAAGGGEDVDLADGVFAV